MNEKKCAFFGSYYICISHCTFQETYSSLCLSVLLFVCTSSWNNSVPTGIIFMKFMFECFSKICQENSIFFLNLKRMGTLQEYQFAFMIVYLPFFLRMKICFRKTCSENCKAHFTFSKVSSTPLPHPKVVTFARYCEKYCRVGWVSTDDNMVHAHCMLDNNEYRHTFGICNIYCFSTATMIASMLVVLRYT